LQSERRKKEKEIVTPLATLPSAAMANANWKQNMRSKQHHREITSFFLQISFSVFLLQMSFHIYFCVHIIFVVSQYMRICYSVLYLLPFFVLVIPRIPTDVPLFTFCYCC